MLSGVAEQVRHDLVQLARIALDIHRPVGHLHPPDVPGAGGAGVADRVEQGLAQIHLRGGQFGTVVQPGQQQHLLDQSAHPL